MNRDYEQTEFSRSLLAGVFAGITATVVSLVFNAIFRWSVGFPLTELINVSTLIFVLILAVTLSGIMFYFLHHHFKRGTLMFQLIGVVFTALLIVGTMYIQRSSDAHLAREFRELLTGIIGITAICVVFMIPFLFRTDYV